MYTTHAISSLMPAITPLHNLLTILALATQIKADVPNFTDLTSYQAGALGEAPTQSFFSSPLKAPIYQINKFDAEKVDDTGYVFLTGGYDGYGPSIISSKDLSLVYADQSYSFAQAASTGTLYGEQVLVVYAGDAVRIFNTHYELLYAVTPQGDLQGWYADSHEAYLSPDDTVVLVVGRREPVNLEALGSGYGTEEVTNILIQEVDPQSNAVLFEFDLLDYFSPEDSFWPKNGSGPYRFDDTWDPWHVNAVQKTAAGDFLISSRHLHSVFLVDGATAEVKWVMGGKRSDFIDISTDVSAVFRWQHNAQFTAENRIMLFDNQGVFNDYCTGEEIGWNCSRGLEIQFDTESWTYWVVEEWYHPQGLVSASRGGVNRTPKGNTLVAWGQNPMYTEHDPDGEVVMDIQRGRVLALDHGISSVIAYRAWKSEWIGMPKWPPSIAVNDTEDGTKIYVSWNGATEVETYMLLTSDSITDLNGLAAVTAKSRRMGFETSFPMTVNRTFARIAALDSNGTILGYTKAIDTMTHETVDPGYPVDNIDSLKTATTSSTSTLSFSTFACAALIIVVVCTALLASWTIRGTQVGVRWDHARMAEYKKKARFTVSHLLAKIRGLRRESGEEYLSIKEEEESLIGEEGKRR